MNLEIAEKIVNEHKGGPVLGAVIVLLEADLEKFKASLLRQDDPEIRGRGQGCLHLIKRLSMEDIVDTEE